MSYFQPGLQEIRRLVQRAQRRWQLRRVHRQLDDAETQLGLLGWQQADFYGEIQEQVSALHNVEREQARLTNQSGMLAQELRTVRETRAQIRGEYDAKRGKLQAQAEKVRLPLADAEKKLDDLRDGESDTDHKVHQLEKELRDVEKTYNKNLLIQPQTADLREEILRLRQRIISIPNEKKDLKANHARNITEIHTRELQRNELRKQLEALETGLHELREAFEKEDGALHKKENALAKEKENAESECDRIERAKSNPYLEIGRVLADHNIAPMNQPEALTQVKSLRKEIIEHEDFIAASIATSSAEDPSTVRISLGLWVVVILSVTLIVASAF